MSGDRPTERGQDVGDGLGEWVGDGLGGFEGLGDALGAGDVDGDAELPLPDGLGDTLTDGAALGGGDADGEAVRDGATDGATVEIGVGVGRWTCGA